jgi:hypothetical protein
METPDDWKTDDWRVCPCIGLCGEWTDGSQYCSKTHCANVGAGLEEVFDMTTTPPTVVARREHGTAAKIYPADFDEESQAFAQDALGWVSFACNGVSYRANAVAGHALRVTNS